MKVDKKDVISHFENIDLLICSSGFEDRSIALAANLDSSKIKNAIIYHIDENYIKSFENYQKIKTQIEIIEKIEFPKNNSIETFDIICNSIDSYLTANYIGEKLNIVVDVTTFTREVLLILVKILSFKDVSSKMTINLTYTPAESYPCEWLTKGVREIRSIFGYSGMTYPSKKLLLVILNGFETERTEEIINSFEANNILLGKPAKSESINEKLNDISNEKYEIIKNKYISKILEEFEFSCLEMDKTVEIINQIIERYSENFNIVISPLNNKVSTLACAVAAINNEDIQICYASANQYNINAYSKESDYFLAFKFNDFLTT